MSSSTWPGPRRSVEELADRLGQERVVGACIDMLRGRAVDGQIVYALGGPPARWAIDGGEPGPDYWLRVWALRGLQWVWTDKARSAVVAALTDDAWRVREMAVKVSARRRIEEAQPSLLDLREDSVDRVRAAAMKALST